MPSPQWVHFETGILPVKIKASNQSLYGAELNSLQKFWSKSGICWVFKKKNSEDL